MIKKQELCGISKKYHIKNNRYLLLNEAKLFPLDCIEA